MNKKNIIIILVIAIIVVIVGAIMVSNVNNTNKNIINDSNNSVIDNSSDINLNDNSSNVISHNKTNAKEPTVVSKKWVENGQAGNRYLEVTYSDGNFRQYDESGKLIGSSFRSDQKELLKGREMDFN